MVKVLVLDGEQRAALAIARALSRRGVYVSTASNSGAPIVARSRSVCGFERCPDVYQDCSDFEAWLRELGDDALVVPVTDATTMSCRNNVRLQDDGYDSLTNKANLLDIATAFGVPIPTGHVAFSAEEALQAAGGIGYPVVWKPARSRLRLDGRVLATSVRLVRKPSEMEVLAASNRWFPKFPAIIQEFIPGHGAGVFCLYDRDHAIAWFAHRRIREKPPSGGVSVLCESVPVDPVLKDYAERLLRAASYRGVAMVEFRIGTDGKPYLMEVNARFWGSLQLAIDCGVDFPWLYYQMLMGERVEPVTQYQMGRRLRWFLGDVDNLLLQLRDRQQPWTAKAAAVGRFVGTSFDPRCRQEVFRWSDPGPGLLEMRQWVGGVLGRA